MHIFDSPVVMGIINATPDSFFAPSRVSKEDDFAQRAKELISDGASIIDIGAFSTRPNANEITENEELARLELAVRAVRKAVPDAIISVDTFRASVARKAVEEWGADIINDISGGNIDPEMFPTVAELNVPYILCHSRGSVNEMMQLTDYESFTRDVLYEIAERVNRLSLLGVNDIIIDPGFGFSKTLNQNYQLLGELYLFKIFNRPILVGYSRKSMITKVLGCSTEVALASTVALNTLALDRGASILRVHDPKPASDAIKIYSKLQSCLLSE